MRVHPIAGLLLLVALGSCSDDFTATERQTIGIRPVAQFPDSLPHADSTSLSVEVFSLASDARIDQAAVHWSSSDTTVIRIIDGSSDSMDAVVHAVGAGVATIKVTVTAGSGAAERQDYSHDIRVPERWLSVAAGGLQTCALNIDSLPFCWGEEGYIGDGTLAEALVPRAVLASSTLRGTIISSGAYASCMLESRGLLYCWGPNVHGEVGDGTIEPRYFPTIGGAGRIYQHVSVGGSHTCANLKTLEEGAAMCWGQMDLSQTGATPVLGAERRCVYYMDFPTLRAVRTCFPSPTNPVEGPLHSPLSGPVSTGGFHGCVVDDGKQTAPAGWVWCWGLGSTGQVGEPIHQGDVCSGNTRFGQAIVLRCYLFPARRVGGLLPTLMSSVSAGWADDGTHPTTDVLDYISHSCGLSVDSLAYCWGANQIGQLGTAAVDTAGCTMDPLPAVPCSRNARAVETTRKFSVIGAGAQHTCALGTADSLVYCWGGNTKGQLGDQTTTSRPTPARVLTPVAERFISVSVGAWHNCAIAARTGALYCWGMNESGQGGNGTPSPSISPTRVKEPN